MSTNHASSTVNPIEAAKRLQSLNQGQVCRFSSYRISDPEQYSSHSYGDFAPLQYGEPTEEDYFLPDLLSGSGYRLATRVLRGSGLEPVR